MDTMEERVQVLENRVRELEHRIGFYSQASQQINRPQQIYRPEQITRPQIKEYDEIPTPIQIKPTQEKNNISEAVIGKYIIGALAPLLIFISAVSLIALVWNKMSPEAKLSLLVVIGLILTTIGFIRMKKNKNPISHIILGTGSGLLFIDILAANMAFELISNNMTLLLAGLWSLIFLFAYKYIQTFFTIIIAYMGSFVALYLGLTLVSTETDYFMLIVFTVCIITTMIGTGYKWFNHWKQLVCTLFSLISVSCLLFFGIFDIPQLLENWLYYVIFLVVVIQALSNRTYYLFVKLKLEDWSFIIGGVASFLTLFGLHQLEFNWYVSIFMVVLLIQILYIEWKNYKSTASLTKLYSWFMIFLVMIISTEFIELPIGVSIVAVFLLLIDRMKKMSRYDFLAGGIIILESLLIIGSSMNSMKLGFIILSICISLGVLSYLLYNKYNYKNSNNMVFLKVILFCSSMSNLFFLIISINEESFVYAFLSITILLIVFFVSGFFRDWNNSDFKWFTNNKKVNRDKSVFSFYAMTTFLYFIGLIMLADLYLWYEQLIIIICVLLIALIQSANLLKSRFDRNLVGFWIGFKYCFITWVVLNVTFEQAVDSLAFSVSGLLLALLCIIIGFIIKIKSLRLYGLILTVLMVLKFILIDLSQENSITRVLALMVGGIICFGISVLYNKLNNIVEQENI